MHTLDDSSGGALVRDILAVSLQMRRLGLDAVIDCELFSRVSALLSFSTGAPVRAGFTPHTGKACTAAASSTTASPTAPTSTSAKQFLSLVDALQSPDAMPRNRAGIIRAIPAEPELAVPFTEHALAVYPQPGARRISRSPWAAGWCWCMPVAASCPSAPGPPRTMRASSRAYAQPVTPWG